MSILAQYVFSGGAADRDNSQGPIGRQAHDIAGEPWCTNVRLAIPATMLLWRLDFMMSGGQGETSIQQLLACNATATACVVQPASGASIPADTIWTVDFPGDGRLLWGCPPGMNSGHWFNRGSLRLTDGTAVGVAWRGVAQLTIRGRR